MANSKISLDPAKAALTTVRAELETALRQYRRSLPLKKLLRYKVALAEIRKAEIKLYMAPCDPPDMTFEIPGRVLDSEELGILQRRAGASQGRRSGRRQAAKRKARKRKPTR
jgi:hypothetical protein